MKQTAYLLLIFSLLPGIFSPVFCENTPLTKEQIKDGIMEQKLNMKSGADNFWSGIIVGSVSTAILIPVYVILTEREPDKKDSIKTIVGINAAVMGTISLGLIVVGGTEWMLASNKMKKLRQMEVSGMRLSPQWGLTSEGKAETSLGLQIKF